MMEVGRLCVKIAGREAGKKCVVVELIDKTFALVDGQVRRKKCNLSHLEPLDTVLKIKKGASSGDVAKEFKKLGLAMRSSKPRKATQRPLQKRAADRKKAAEPEKKSDQKAEQEKKK